MVVFYYMFLTTSRCFFEGTLLPSKPCRCWENWPRELFTGAGAQREAAEPLRWRPDAGQQPADAEPDAGQPLWR